MIAGRRSYPTFPPPLRVSYLIEIPKTIRFKFKRCRALSSPPLPSARAVYVRTKTPTRPSWGLFHLRLASSPFSPQLESGQNCSERPFPTGAAPASEGLSGSYATEANIDQFVRSQNVGRYRRLLERVTEESDRQQVINLLAEECQSKDAGDLGPGKLGLAVTLPCAASLSGIRNDYATRCLPDRQQCNLKLQYWTSFAQVCETVDLIFLRGKEMLTLAPSEEPPGRC